MARTVSAKSVRKTVGRERLRTDLAKSKLSRAKLIGTIVHYWDDNRRLRRQLADAKKLHAVTQVVLGPVDGVPVAATCILSGCHYWKLAPEFHK